jgi:RNA polymerase sigma factor (sigma-70 family)
MEDDKIRFQNLIVPNLADAFALARWITGDRADAEDILQEASIRAYRGISGFAGGSARAWLLTIVRRTAYSWLGKNRVPMLVSVDDLDAKEREEAERGGNTLGTESETPEAELISRADAARLESAIASLPLEFREALVLRDIQGLNYREISEVMATPIGTVMSRIARSRRRLIALLVDQP